MSKTNRDKRGGHLFIEKPTKRFTAKAMRRESNTIIQSSLLEYEEDQQSYYYEEDYEDWYDGDDYLDYMDTEIIPEDEDVYDYGFDWFDSYYEDFYY